MSNFINSPSSSMDEIEIQVPPFFLCPISLEIMKDPVTVSTGITYDRESIEKWVFSEKHQICPVTKQPLPPEVDLTPNHTLRRLIQSWCTLNSSHGIERFPTPKPPASKTQIVKLLNDLKSPQAQIKCLRKLKSIAATSEANKRCIEAAGGAHFLASLITFDDIQSQTSSPSTSSLLEEKEEENESTEASSEALSMLYSLQLSESGLTSLITSEFVDSLTRAMRLGSFESRAYAVMLLRSIFEVADPVQIASLKPEFFAEVVQVLKDQVTPKATKAGLHILINVGPLGRSRVKAVEAGAVPVLVDMLLDTSSSSEKRVCEMALTVLDQLCQCAEGRAELLGHAAGLAVVSKKILRVSKTASERAARVLHSLAKFAGSPAVLQEMLQVGVVAKLCLVLQVESGTKTKERAREILKLHARVWKNAPCIPMALLSSYPC